MSPSHDPLQPTPFEAARPEPPTSAERETPTGAPRWVVPALLGLLLLAAVVVFWLPRQVGERPLHPTEPAPTARAPGADVTGSDSSQAAQAAPSGPDASPWNDARLARLRKAAQDVLAELLDIQYALQERGIERWAAEEFTAAAEIARVGDELYKQRQYEAATTRYQEGLEALQGLQDSIPEAVDRQLETARLALEAGDIDGAGTALELAALMEPENAGIPPLQQRLATLPQLLERLADAAAAEQADNLAQAESDLEQAVALDPQHQRAASELARISSAYQMQQFNDAMSEGYSALDDNRFSAARDAFRRAASLKEGSEEANDALQEVAAAETAHRLASLKQQGAEQERREQWQAAVATYEKAREIDPSVLFASEGLGRSSGRARLDRQFRAAIDEPGRLSDEKVARATEALLGQARQISPRGPVLAEQIASLEQLLALANTPIEITLYSDQQTEVILFKVARLGRFQQHRLSLRPGKYTAVGQRAGYRDVRREFIVSHDQQLPAVTIRCTEPI